MNETINTLFNFALLYWVHRGNAARVDPDVKSAVTTAVGGRLWAAALNKEDEFCVDIFVYGEDDHDVAETVYTVNVQTGIVDTVLPDHV